MKRATIVVFLILFAPKGFSGNLMDSIEMIESKWARIYYLDTPNQQKEHYPSLLHHVEQVARRYPQSAKPKIWQAILLSANAAYQSPIEALNALDRAKQLLEKAIDIEPNALGGSAFVTLGTLYYMVPGWPISFGDNEMAEKCLTKALKINPNGIDTNYFYGDFLLSQEKFEKAEHYFKNASRAPLRSDQMLADSELRKTAIQSLLRTKRFRNQLPKNKLSARLTTTSLD